MFKIQEGFQIDHTGVPFGIYTDHRDGKQYPYTQFGTQIWMLKDLDYGTRVNVPTTQPGMTQAEGTCFKAKNVDNYGSWTEGRSALYIFPSLSWAVPSGWHVPTKDEWTTLQNWVKAQKGSSNGYPQKALLGKTHWYNLTYAATDEYGFGLLPQGYMYRSWTGTNVYWNYVETTSLTRGYWWSSTSIAENTYNIIYFYNSGSTFSNYTTYYKSGYNIEAFPVRLVKDTAPANTEPEIESITITLSDTPTDTKIPTEKAVKDYVDSQAGGGMENPMSSYGDLIVGGASGTPSALSAGSVGQVLTIGASGVPEWANGGGGGGMVNPMTTANDIIIGGSSGAPSRLGVGSPGQILKVGTTGITWDDEAVVSISDTDSIGLTIDQNGDLTADLKIDSSSGNVSLTAGSDGLYGNVEFPVAALDSGSPGILVSGNVDNEYNIGLALSEEPDNILQLKDTGNEGLYAPPSELDGLITTAGDLIVGGASGVPDKLSVGTNGQVLTSNGTTAGWAVIPGLYLGAFATAERPANAITGQCILDTTLGYIVYKYEDKWINSTGAYV